MALVLLLAAASSASAQSPASPGRALLQRMHAAYDGKWYRTLTFVQRTIVARPTGVVDTTTWYESLSGPARLRIDMGLPSLGNGVLYTADSSFRIRGGTLQSANASGNLFLPLIMGVYLQPIDVTERQLRAFKFDLDRSTEGTWLGRRAIIIGASAVTDSLSPQFWIDAERMVAVRVRGTLFGARSSDIELGGYEKIGAAWLATRVSITTGAQRQTEEYSDWKAGMDLPEALFDVAHWGAAAHWASKK
jgi:hypothetical protein